MLIVSNFHDYYDTISKHGVDKSLVYKRKTQSGSIIDLASTNRMTPKEKIFRSRSFGAVRVSSWSELIVFCGEFYEVFCSKVSLDIRQFLHFSPVKRDLDDLATEVYGVIEEIPSRFSTFLRRDDLDQKVKEIDWKALCINEGSPVLRLQELSREEKRSLPFSCPKVRVIKNPVLKEIEFFRVIDAYSAHQRISEFLGGVMGQSGKPMISLSDKDLVRKHGFDKWSFRKTPER